MKGRGSLEFMMTGKKCSLAPDFSVPYEIPPGIKLPKVIMPRLSQGSFVKAY